MNRAVVHFGIQCFQLRHVHRVGVFRTGRHIRQLARHLNVSERNGATAGNPCSLFRSSHIVRSQIAFYVFSHFRTGIHADSNTAGYISLRLISQRDAASDRFRTNAERHGIQTQAFRSITEGHAAFGIRFFTDSDTGHGLRYLIRLLTSVKSAGGRFVSDRNRFLVGSCILSDRFGSVFGEGIDPKRYGTGTSITGKSRRQRIGIGDGFISERRGESVTGIGIVTGRHRAVIRTLNTVALIIVHALSVNIFVRQIRIKLFFAVVNHDVLPTQLGIGNGSIIDAVIFHGAVFDSLIHFFHDGVIHGLLIRRQCGVRMNHARGHEAAQQSHDDSCFQHVLISSGRGILPVSFGDFRSHYPSTSDFAPDKFVNFVHTYSSFIKMGTAIEKTYYWSLCLFLTIFYHNFELIKVLPPNFFD